MRSCCVCSALLPKPESNWGTPEHPVCDKCSRGLMPMSYKYLGDLPIPQPVGHYRYLMIEKRQRPVKLEQSYFAQFSGDKLRRVRCSNCGAMYLESEPFKPGERNICCAHCAFNPEGCRCKYGEYGVSQSYRDDFYPWDK